MAACPVLSYTLRLAALDGPSIQIVPSRCLLENDHPFTWGVQE